MDNTVSLISKENSTCIKGILIFLIILGHNMCFTIPLEKWGVMTYLYTFHIQGFFLLPFLYGSKPLTKDGIIKNFVRLYWPYFVLATILMIGYGVFTHFCSFTPANLGKLYLCGSEAILRTMCGYAALWFLPAMLCTLILKQFFYQSNKAVRGVLLLLSLIINLNTIIDLSIPLYSFVEEWLVGINIAFRYLLLGVILRWLMIKISKVNPTIVLSIAFVFFCIGTIIYIINVVPYSYKSATLEFRILTLWMPIAFMFLMCQLLERQTLSKDSVWNKFGELSLPIYLVSPFIGYAAYFSLLRFNLVCWETGIIMQFIITAIAYLIAKYIIKGRIKQFLMPRSTDELKKSLEFMDLF